jgi:hypothetical protein
VTRRTLRIEPSIGSPLAPALRVRIHHDLGFDPGSVRVHTDGAAARAASALRAAAFTVGPHVFFGAGRFDPGTRQGLQLLAHEMVHVRQQPAGRAFRAQEVSPTRRAALEAEALAAAGMGGGQPVRSGPTAFAPLHLSASHGSPAVPLTASLDEAGDATRSGADGSDESATTVRTPPEPDLGELARDVYRLLEWRLLVGRERGGVQQWR